MAEKISYKHMTKNYAVRQKTLRIVLRSGLDMTLC